MSRGDYIPSELQIEIMKRLPVESLLKFRSVSKTWKSVIQSSEFIADYKSSTHHLLLSVNDERYIYIFNDDDDNRPPKHKSRVPIHLPSIGHRKTAWTMFGCSQGLFAFASYCGLDDDGVAVIWNPSIRKSVNIPVPNVLGGPYKTVFGFGVCNATDPMIVKINYIADDNFESISSIPWQVEVFKLSTRKWMSLSDTCRLPRKSLYFTDDKTCVVIDGFIYWIAIDRTSNGYDYNNLIMSFNMTSEHFTEIHLPDTLANTTFYYIYMDILKLGESLVVFQTKFKQWGREYDVWIMEMMEHDSQNSFKKLYTIKDSNASIQRVIGFRKSGQPIIYTWSDFLEQTSLLVYEPNSQQFTDIIRITPTGIPRLASSYKRTMLLLNH